VEVNARCLLEILICNEAKKNNPQACKCEARWHGYDAIVLQDEYKYFITRQRNIKGTGRFKRRGEAIFIYFLLNEIQVWMTKKKVHFQLVSGLLESSRE